jgi:hypothetical protein
LRRRASGGRCLRGGEEGLGSVACSRRNGCSGWLVNEKVAGEAYWEEREYCFVKGKTDWGSLVALLAFGTRPYCICRYVTKRRGVSSHNYREESLKESFGALHEGI